MVVHVVRVMHKVMMMLLLLVQVQVRDVSRGGRVLASNLHEIEVMSGRGGGRRCCRSRCSIGGGG